MTTGYEDTEAILNEGRVTQLKDGTSIRIRDVGTREIFKFLKILTRGVGGALTTLDYSDGETFGQQLGLLILLSVPEAEDETIEFLQAMVEPADLMDPKGGKGNVAFNQDKWNLLAEKMVNPAPEDSVAILLHLIKVEGPELRRLGDTVWAMLKLQFPQLSRSSSESTENSTQTELSETSPEDSTSSSPSTDGPTSESSTSPSAASTKSRRRSASAKDGASDTSAT